MKDTHQRTRECPLCGEKMRIKETETVNQIPGTAEFKRLKVSEWVCPECEYFEEVEEEGRG
jgi:C4-type Zn-finger protein